MSIGVGEPAGDDRHGMEPQVPADVRDGSRPVACRIAGVRSAPADRTTIGARTIKRRVTGTPGRSGRSMRPARRRVRDDGRPLDAHGPPALDQDPEDADPRHDPGARRVRPGEMDPEAALLGATRAPERTAAAGPAVDRVPARRGRLPAEGGRSTQDGLVLRRDDRRRGDRQLGLDRRDIVGPTRRPTTPWRPCAGRPFAPGPPRSATMLVIQFTSVPPPTPLPDSIVIAPSQVERRPWFR